MQLRCLAMHVVDLLNSLSKGLATMFPLRKGYSEQISLSEHKSSE